MVQTPPKSEDWRMINLIYNKEEYPIPRCTLVGYGRTQIRRFICYNCHEEFFLEQDEFGIEHLICEECIGLKKDVVINSDTKQYLDIVGWRQEVATFKRRTNYNYIKVAKRDNYTCQYCGYSPRLFVEFKPMHVDHIIPFSYGGNNSMKNLVMACSDCNMHVSNKVFKDFHSKKEFIIEWRKEKGLPFTKRRWEQLSENS